LVFQPDDLPAQLRAAIGATGFPKYRIAAAAQLHPGTLSRYLHGALPVPQDVADRVFRSCEALAAEGRK
jgi:hypothetical protein